MSIAWTPGGVGGGSGDTWTRVTLASDYTTSSTAVENITGMQATLDDESTYRIRAVVRFANNSGVNSTTAQIALGSSTLNGRVNVLVNGIWGAGWLASGSAYAALASVGAALNNGLDGMAHFEGIVTLSGATRTIRLVAYSATASANLTVLAGSYFEYIKLV